MVVLSKFYSKLQNNNITLTQTAFFAATLSFIGGYLYPKLKKSKNGKSSVSSSQKIQDQDKNSSGAVVNQQFLERLKKLIKV